MAIAEVDELSGRMPDIPEFSEAVREFQSFLAREGVATRLVWAFRDDLWQLGQTRVLVRWPEPDQTCRLMEKVFAEGRAKDLVEIVALAQTTDWIVATVWYPKYESDEVQGWSQNMKLAIRQPLPKATRVTPLLWSAFVLLPGFRRYQRTAFGVGTREWAES
jgi:hypothetical protein